MACTRPIQGTRGSDGKVTVRPSLGPAKGAERRNFKERIVEIPCGQCLDCRIARTDEWASRCLHEAAMHKHTWGPHRGATNGCFLTLTFSESGLRKANSEAGRPANSVAVRDWQLFAKRLRKEVGPFRFLHVGEYGDENKRPHYHALLFGQDFTKDRIEWKEQNGNPYFVSPTLAKLWPQGHHLIGDITPETVNYVCRYVQKKITGSGAEADAMRSKEYERVSEDGKTRWQVNPEYATMSRRPGLGRGWLEKWMSDVFPRDAVVIQGKERRVPSYYTDLLKMKNPAMWEMIKAARRAEAAKRDEDNTPERRAVRKEVTKAKLGLQKKRKLS